MRWAYPGLEVAERDGEWADRSGLGMGLAPGRSGKRHTSGRGSAFIRRPGCASQMSSCSGVASPPQWHGRGGRGPGCFLSVAHKLPPAALWPHAENKQIPQPEGREQPLETRRQSPPPCGSPSRPCQAVSPLHRGTSERGSGFPGLGGTFTPLLPPTGQETEASL